MGLGTEMAGWLRSRNTLVAMLDVDKAGAPRIHPRRLPESATTTTKNGVIYPRAIVYHKISDVTVGSLGGAVKLANAIMQFDCYGRSPDEADNLRERLKKELDGLFRGQLGNLFISGIEHEGDRDETEEPIDASDEARFVCQCDYRLSYQRPTT